MSATCPDEHTHSGGKDKHPSFGVRISATGKSRSFCHACGLKDTAEWIAYARGSRDLLDAVVSKVSEPENYWRRSNRERFGMPAKSPPFIVPEFALDFCSGAVPRYIIDRGFPLDVCRAWELGYDRQESRCVFVIRDRLGRLRAIAGRALQQGRKPKYATYVWDRKGGRFSPRYDHSRDVDFISLEKSRVLYGEHMVAWDRRHDDYAKALIVVEGYTDAIRLWQHGFTACGVMGDYLSDEQADAIVEMLPPDGFVVTVGDGDKGGATLVHSAHQQLSSRVRSFWTMCSAGKDPGELSEAEAIARLDSRSTIDPIDPKKMTDAQVASMIDGLTNPK